MRLSLSTDWSITTDPADASADASLPEASGNDTEEYPVFLSILFSPYACCCSSVTKDGPAEAAGA
jgi:hypothetical protein